MWYNYRAEKDEGKGTVKIIKSIILGTSLLALAVVIVMFWRPSFNNADQLSSGLVPTLAPPIDVSKLHVVKITQVDFPCQAVSIAPDGEHYVCSKGSTDPELWLSSFSNGLEKRLADNGEAAGWLPNGRQIIYAEIVRDHPRMLYALDVENGNRTPIASTKMPLGGDHFQILPNGRVLFLKGNQLQVWDSHTLTLKPMQGQGCIDAKITPAVDSFYTAVSPDGQHLADLRAQVICLEDISTGKVITLTNEVEFATRQMAWSPDGHQLAFSFARTDTRRAELWLVNADGTNPRRLWRNELARAFEFLTWMPDGQTLLFINDNGSFELGWTYMAISVKGGPPKALFTYGEGLRLFDNGRKILILRSVRESNLPEGDFIVELSQ